MRFALDIVAVFLYAAIRPRFGPGLRTAVIAGLVIWFVGYVLPTIVISELGVFDAGKAAALTIWGLVEAPLATSVGGWLYREES